jgi:hypothetical protein
MSGTVSRVVSPAPRSEWLRLMKVDPTSTLSQSPEWMDALCSFTAWRDASRYYETTEGHSFVLPLAEKGFGRTGRVLASMPAGWGMGGFVSERPVGREDTSLVMEDLKNLRGLAIRILPNPIQTEAWTESFETRTTTISRFSHVLDLNGGFDTVWKDRFRKTARRNTRKASLGDLEIERDTTGRLIPVYRDLFRRSVERWAKNSNEPLWLARIRASREDPAGKLEYLAESLGDQMVTIVAWHQGEPAAANIFLTGNSAFYWRGAMHEELGPATHAAYALQAASIEEACESGASYYYFGESGQSKGLAHFKERFGAVGYSYLETRHELLPFTRSDQVARAAVKRLVGYRTS